MVEPTENWLDEETQGEVIFPQDEPEESKGEVLGEPSAEKKSITSVVSTIEELAENKSPEAARFFTVQLKELLGESQGSAPDQKLLRKAIRELEQIPSLRDVQERAFETLKQIGAIRYSPEGEMIANLEKIKGLTHQDLRKTGSILESKYYGANDKSRALFYIFKDRPVISEEDYLAGERESKPLFYSPKSQENAFDINNIKQADFYLGMWELSGKTYSGKAYPSVENGADFSEVSVACLVYHPRYGNGYRDETGKLLVYDPERKEHRPVSGERLLRGSLGLKYDFHNRPAEYVKSDLPDLNQRGLLTSDDFEIKPGLRGEFSYFTKREIDKNGSVMIGGIQYFIGKGKQFDNATVHQISDKTALVYKDGKVTHLFALQNPDNPNLKIQSQGAKGSYSRATKGIVDLTPFNRETYFKKKEDESDEQFKERAAPVEDFELWAKLNDFFGENVSSNLLDSMELDPNKIRAVLASSEKLGPEFTEEIVKGYQEITKSAREIGNFIRTNLNAKGDDEKTIQSVVRTILKRALNLVLSYGKNPPMSPDQIKTDLANLRSEVQLFANTFKGLKNEGEPIRLEDFAKFQVEVETGDQISQREKDQMEQMIIRNRLERPDIINQARAEFNQALKSSDTSFYLLRYGNDLVGFFRLDRHGKLDAHLGSLNVPREIQGSGIGDEILKTFFTQALNGRVGHASADPRNPITPLYIGRYQFVGSAVKAFGETGRPFIEMSLDPQLNSRLEYLNVPDSEVVALFSRGDHPGQSELALRFEESQLDALMDRAREILSSGQYLLTAFRKITTDRNEYIYAVFELRPELAEQLQKAA